MTAITMNHQDTTMTMGKHSPSALKHLRPLNGSHGTYMYRWMVLSNLFIYSNPNKCLRMLISDIDWHCIASFKLINWWCNVSGQEGSALGSSSHTMYVIMGYVIYWALKFCCGGSRRTHGSSYSSSYSGEMVDAKCTHKLIHDYNSIRWWNQQ